MDQRGKIDVSVASVIAHYVRNESLHLKKNKKQNSANRRYLLIHSLVAFTLAWMCFERDGYNFAGTYSIEVAGNLINKSQVKM